MLAAHQYGRLSQHNNVWMIDRLHELLKNLAELSHQIAHMNWLLACPAVVRQTGETVACLFVCLNSDSSANEEHAVLVRMYVGKLLALYV